jgi:hypothetical protein
MVCLRLDCIHHSMMGFDCCVTLVWESKKLKINTRHGRIDSVTPKGLSDEKFKMDVLCEELLLSCLCQIDVSLYMDTRPGHLYSTCTHHLHFLLLLLLPLPLILIIRPFHSQRRHLKITTIILLINSGNSRSCRRSSRLRSSSSSSSRSLLFSRQRHSLLLSLASRTRHNSRRNGRFSRDGIRAGQILSGGSLHERLGDWRGAQAFGWGCG